MHQVSDCSINTTNNKICHCYPLGGGRQGCRRPNLYPYLRFGHSWRLLWCLGNAALDLKSHHPRTPRGRPYYGSSWFLGQSPLLSLQKDVVG